MEARSELNSYFDTLNKQYVQLAQAEKAERKMAHPGKLDHAMGKDAEVPHQHRLLCWLANVTRSASIALELKRHVTMHAEPCCTRHAAA
eukprot:410294-Rhodomonas_salina.1